MLMNFIAFVVCAVAAIYQGVNGNLGSCLLDIALALINLPYAIKWLKEFLQIESQFYQKENTWKKILET